jgi:hypothetical protein
MLALACVFALCPLAQAQYRGAIRGVVADPQGAVVPGASITLLNTDTNLALKATSDQFGIYNFNAIPAAHYKVTVEKPGFKTKVIESLEIIPDQLNALNLQIEVGEVKETVTVTGTTETVDAETATVSGTLRTSEIQTMPAVLRNVFMLAQLAPGVFGDNSQGAGGGGNNLPGSAGPGNPGGTPGVNSGIFATENGPQVVTGGMGYQHNGISVDGISTTSAVWGGTSVITPSQDSIAEVKVTSNSYDAENGRFAGVQIQVTSKSGSNQPHGDAFVTLHRPGLDAAPSWDGLTTPAKDGKDTNFNTNFGGNLGGPIWKNKLFGFFNWETNRSPKVQASPGVAWMETTAFQGLAPAGSIASKFLSYPGSIPSNPSINDVSCANIGLNSNNCIMVPGKGLNLGSPLTTGLGTQDLGWVSASNPGVGGGLNPSGPADIAEYNVLNKTTYSQNQYIGRVDAYLTQKDRLAGSIYWVPQSQTSLGHRAYDLFHHNQTNNAFSLIWNHTFSPTLVNEARFNAAGWRWNEASDNSQLPVGLPVATIADGNGNASIGSISIEQYGPPYFSHLDQWTYSYKDVATKIFGRHTVKFGGELTRLYYLNANVYGVIPNYQFYNMWDFLNDAPHSESANANPATGTLTQSRQDNRENIGGLFAQDDFKLRSNLTLNLGLRWSYFGPLSSTEGNMYRAVPGAGSAFLTGMSVVKENSWNAEKHNFSPQIGVAWSPKQFQNKLVVRGGFGLSYNQEEIAISANISGNPGLAVSQSLSSGNNPASINPSIQYVTASGLHSLSYPANPAFKASFGSNGLPTTGSTSLFLFPQNMPTFYAEHYSLDVQYEFWPKWTASLGYNGNNSHNVIANAQLFPYAASKGYALNPAIAGDGWTNYWNASGYGNYNAMLAEVKSNLWHGVMFDTQFNWSKSLDTNTGPYTYEIYPYKGSLNYARSDNDVARAWKFFGSYSPKFFKGKADWMEKTMGGWTITGIFNVHSGFPWTPQIPISTLTNNEYSSLYCGSCWYNNVYPVAKSGAGSDTSNSAYKTGSNYGGQAANHQTYFTEPTFTAYAGAASAGNYGNANPPAGMKRNWITGPGYRSLDMTLVKAFTFPKAPVLGEAARLEFRADAYNLFNNLNLTGGNNGIDRNISDPNFGISNGALGARVVTLGARFQF